MIHEDLLLSLQVQIEVVETVSDKEQDKWGPINVDEVSSLISIEFHRKNIR